MNNRDFVIQVLKVKDPKAIDRCLTAMDKYGDNHWWESDVNPRKFAFYQIQEPVMLGAFVYFGEALMLLLNRVVEPDELMGNDLIEEVKKAWANQIKGERA
jgi:hypothetical protein